MANSVPFSGTTRGIRWVEYSIAADQMIMIASRGNYHCQVNCSRLTHDQALAECERMIEIEEKKHGIPRQSIAQGPSSTPDPFAGARAAFAAAAQHQQQLQRQYSQYLNQLGGLAQQQQNVFSQYHQQALQQAAQQWHVAEPERAKPLPTSKIILGELVGWRAWSVNSSELLCGVSRSSAVWPPEEPMDGKVPSGDGGGIYAFAKQRAFLESDFGHNRSLVWGTVFLWGDLVEHELGYRAQFAKVRSIDHCPPAWSKSDHNKLRQRYHVQ